MGGPFSAQLGNPPWLLLRWSTVIKICINLSFALGVKDQRLSPSEDQRTSSAVLQDEILIDVLSSLITCTRVQYEGVLIVLLKNLYWLVLLIP